MAKFKALLLENIHPVAKSQLEAEGFEVELLKHAPPEDELIELLQNYNAVGLRSKTKITERVLKETKLTTVCCFCIGTNQVDLEVANKMGIPVFNAPHSNTRSVAELMISHIVALSRQIGDRNMKAHNGVWAKSAVGANEIRNKTLGIIGYGHIGSQVSVLAEAMGMKVQYYDVVKKLPLGNANQVPSLKELLNTSDFVTLHVPETPETKQMFGKKQLDMMKKGAYLINAARGSTIIIEDLAASIESGHLGGCAIDVFPKEPRNPTEEFSSPLQGLPNVILTPHIGGSTEEAQENIGYEVSESMAKYFKTGSTLGAVNFPEIDTPLKDGSARMLNIHKNEPGVLGEINNIISNAGVNIDGQYLSTDENIGYLVVDVHTDHVDKIADEVKKLTTSIKTRVVR
jgi:D-3-phosphoglycerate dehydrogenase